MTKENNDLLRNFMKKQISPKLANKNSAEKNNAISVNSAKSSKDDKDSEEAKKKELEEAKKESKGRASNYDQSLMIKRMFLEAITKYVLVIAVAVLAVLSLIQLGPVISDALHGLVFKVIIGGAK